MTDDFLLSRTGRFLWRCTSAPYFFGPDSARVRETATPKDELDGPFLRFPCVLVTSLEVFDQALEQRPGRLCQQTVHLRGRKTTTRRRRWRWCRSRRGRRMWTRKAC